MPKSQFLVEPFELSYTAPGDHYVRSASVCWWHPPAAASLRLGDLSWDQDGSGIIEKKTAISQDGPNFKYEVTDDYKRIPIGFMSIRCVSWECYHCQRKPLIIYLARLIWTIAIETMLTCVPFIICKLLQQPVKHSREHMGLKWVW